MTSTSDNNASTIMKVFLTCYQDSGETQIVNVVSREYVILILALNSKTTSHLMCVPYKDALDMSSHLVQISHNAQEKSVTVKLVGKTGHKSFTATILDEYNEIHSVIFKSTPFLMTVGNFWSISSTCMDITSLPIILNDPLPRHLSFLNELSASNIDPLAITPPATSAPKSPDDVCKTESHDPSTSSSPPPPSKTMPSTKNVEADNATSVEPKKTNVEGIEDCPVCHSAFPLQKPEHVGMFARHYYKHYPVNTQLIPVFIQTIMKLKQLQGKVLNMCPLDFCCQPLSAEKTLSKHIRRHHQFEVLLLHLLMKDRNFLNTNLYKILLENCKNEKVKSFIVYLFHSKEKQSSPKAFKKEAIEEEKDLNRSDGAVVASSSQGHLSTNEKAPMSKDVKMKKALDKTKATDLMKQFFRQNYEDKDCQSFLTSRGEVLTVKVYEKLVCFIYLVAQDAEDASLLVQFALKNLKTILDSGRNLSKESLQPFLEELNSIHYLIQDFKEKCQTLNISPSNCQKTLLLSLLQSLTSGCETEVNNMFLKWLSSVHVKIDDKMLEDHMEFTNISSAKCDAVYLSCSTCNEEVEDVPSFLVHLGRHEGKGSVVCTACQYSLQDLCILDQKKTVQSFYLLQNHLLSKLHINNSTNEDKIESVNDFCDVCNIAYEDVSEHCENEKHMKNIVIIKEYLVFCQARSLDPVNHKEFPEFIFFLRYIYSLSVELKLSIRQTMEVVSNIHSNFNKLLNVNESMDVTDEVINKLSATQPSVFFCFTCSEGFLTNQDCSDHFADNDCTSVRCVICKYDVEKVDVEDHYHEEDFGLDQPETMDEESQQESSTSAVNREELIDEADQANEDQTEQDIMKGSEEVRESRKYSKEEVTLEEVAEKSTEAVTTSANDRELEVKDKTEELPPTVEVIPANGYVPKFKLPFDANIQEDYHEKVTFDVSLSDILEHKSAPPRTKTIVDHCVEKRKSEGVDPSSLQYPMSLIRYKKLRMDVGLKVDCKEAKLVEMETVTENASNYESEETSDVNDEVENGAAEIGLTISEVKSVADIKKEEESEMEKEDYPEIDLDKNYLPMNFNISMSDIAFEPEWKDYLDPQIQFMKKKAEVFSRWKNDINYYFNIST